MFCGSTKDLQVDHLDGFEENGEAENLLMLCRSCNQLKSAVYKKAGLGRRTVQYNPGVFSSLFGPRETYRTTGGGHPDFRKRLKQERADAKARDRAEERDLRKQELEAKRAERAARPVQVGRYKGFTIYRTGSTGDRVFYSTMDPDTWLDSTREVKRLIDTFKNPAPSLYGWSDAVAVLRGDADGSPFKAARTIRSTPIARRYQYLDRMMRANPGVPTFAQYTWAVRHHCEGQKDKAPCGAHDEGGAIIHATPPEKRREYADKIARMKRGRARESRESERARWD
jgi:hypothetical protein